MNTSVLGGEAAVLPEARAVKQAMRERIRTERRRRDIAAQVTAARGLAAVAMEVPEIARARCVAAYTSTPGAPGTVPLRTALRSSGVRVVLPVLSNDGHLDWAEDGRPERLGIDGIAQAEVVIIPAMAVDTLGNRLGQGAGFYDRTLRTLEPNVMVFALVFESEVLDAAIEPVPDEPHDRPVDAVITPRRCLRLPRRR